MLSIDLPIPSRTDDFQRALATSRFIRNGTIHMDSTGGTNRHGYTLTQLYASTEQGFCVPLAMQVADTETIESFVHFLEQVRAASGPAFAPSCFIIDKGAL